MLIRRLDVAHFRIFKEKSLEFAPGLNWITGENASGKTTLLEALYLLMAGKSFRTKENGDLIQLEAPYLQAEVFFEKWGIPQQLKFSLGLKERKIQYNSSELTSPSCLFGIMPGVLLAPHDLELVKGGPPVRRHYLDFQIAQVDPLYVHHLLRYQKAIKQRNMQIRSCKGSILNVFEEIIGISAAYIMQKREALIHLLNPLVAEAYQNISGEKGLAALRYEPSFSLPSAEAIQGELKSKRPRDAHLGFTSIGIHRDDLILFIEGKKARIFASEGEMRSLAAALKIAEYEWICSHLKERPLLLVDDFGISMDSARKRNLLELISRYKQILLTSPERLDCINTSNYSIIYL